jgi:hypothetical protein
MAAFGTPPSTPRSPRSREMFEEILCGAPKTKSTFEVDTKFVHAFTGEIIMISKRGDTMGSLSKRLNEYKGGHLLKFSMVSEQGVLVVSPKDVFVSGTTIGVIFGDMWPSPTSSPTTSLVGMPAYIIDYLNM